MSNPTEEKQPKEPSSSSPVPTDNPTEEKQPKEPSFSSPVPTDNPTEEKQPKGPSSSPPVPTGNPTEEKQPKEPSSSPAPTENWGTKYMGPPAPPSAHPQNQEAAQWSLPDKTPENHPYMYFAPVDRSPSSSPMENILECFNSWGKKTEALASNIWTSLKTAPSMPEAAWGKLSLTAKALTEGGFESLFKQTFQTHPGEKLKKTFACYLSTSTGPVAGTLYLSNMNIAFCSDRPLSFAAPSGQQAWNYYKVMVPLERVSCINPVTMKESPPEKYLQVVTIDGHEFWFMGFVSYDKASSHLLNTLGEFVSSRVTH